ncbi:conserved Plasmodium protein, unknown function [Plasmodium knowlesi strain H]|uniref:Uncharacterized protein n=3 Tax=Plasmodium knowlesi TaxID=5850 RepID=A0A5K1V0T8_PLAKH|nr:conserved Plasmodium protein, unknown function [Plasmodium knowlesi strain H]OTN67070.1 Uncharacterized protein PKNOH_S07456600 [Plasmodium knowlesi]CAA9988692.1 conserved Plasmodium protein, unknown function [Plasmodium knowlesi strain H]SBO21614.1 conserved Plasmodium protein, unknown function [Plasmodium knowlesi strain H]SBO21982.1 conserved Plasmodium protein, unknown function [Plasmodium knowlesi strain H]VVS78166.1 conserved Plasmodium protein, unknown function [Plasmodium knowlesi s|eukprot:XP_002259669.1 hypothetical protein, conserved in Plasmodium species [Plasmodium knowlesi strain H]
MYLFKKAKDSIVNSLQYDKGSPLMRLQSVCKGILWSTFLVSFALLLLTVLTMYFERTIFLNKDLLQTLTVASFLLCLLSLTILRRKSGTYIYAKVEMYPFSFKDLIDVSLVTGTVTISVLDIFLCYLFLIVIFFTFLTALFSLYVCLDNPSMKDNENISLFSIQFTSISYIGLYAITQFCAFKSMPYHPVEYLGYIVKNIMEDIFCVVKKAWKFIY